MGLERVVLLLPQGKKHVVNLDRDTVVIPAVGVVRADVIRASVGRRCQIGKRSFLVLTPSVRDELGAVRRSPQIVGPKDAPALVWNCDLKAGDVVVEAGAGSGALTLVLAHAVGPEGRVITYDIEESRLELARGNVAAAGFEGRVAFRRADVRLGVEEHDVDAFVLDIPDPWDAVGAALGALRPCGHFAAFSPNVEQVSRTAAALRRETFVEIRTIEILEREMESRNSGTHPSFAPLGHTGYMTFARKVLEAL